MVDMEQDLFFDNTDEPVHHEVLEMVLHLLKGHSDQLLMPLF